MLVRLLVGLSFLLGPLLPASAQSLAYGDTTRTVDTTQATPPQVTLVDWAAQRRRLLLDRVHNVGPDRFNQGVHYDRGVFRHITPVMDREYAIDMLTYRFPLGEAARWHQADRGLRLRGGSIERSMWALVTELKETVSLGSSHRLTIDARLQEDGRARGTFLELGYQYAVSGRHAVGLQHTFSRYKPDYDLTAFYRASLPRWGRARIGLTLDNAYNNFVYSTLGVGVYDEDILRIYNTPPLVARVQMTTADQYPVQLELYAGWRPEVTVSFASQTDDTFQYQDAEAAHYVSALVSYEWRAATVGLFYQQDRSSLVRTGGGSGVPSDYRSSQHLSRYGVVARGAWRNWTDDLRYAVGRYTDRQTGQNFTLSTLDGPLDYWEDRHTARVRLQYAPNRGVQAGLKYTAYVRDLDKEESRYLARQWTGENFWVGTSNYRLTPLIGYRWSRGNVLMGLASTLTTTSFP